MSPEDAREKLKLGADFLATYLSGKDVLDTPGLKALRQESLGAVVQGLTYVTLAAASTIGKVSEGTSLEEVLHSLPPEDEILVPNVQRDPEGAILLALGRTREAEKRLDIPAALDSSFGLALSAVKELGRRTERTPLAVAQMFSRGAEPS